MSKNRGRVARARDSRRDQRRMRWGTIALTALCAAALGAMALVNHMPIGDRYTYTDGSDLWFVEGGEMAVAAPEVLPHVAATDEPSPTPTAEPSATPAPTATHTAAPSATPAPVAEAA